MKNKVTFHRLPDAEFKVDWSEDNQWDVAEFTGIDGEQSINLINSIIEEANKTNPPSLTRALMELLPSLPPAFLLAHALSDINRIVKQHNEDQFTEPEDLDEAMKKFNEFLDRLAEEVQKDLEAEPDED
jgi:hypothetical protein